MAYTLSLLVKCDLCKTAKASVELYSFRNDRLGKFCGACGRTRLRVQEKIEKDTYGVVDKTLREG